MLWRKLFWHKFSFSAVFTQILAKLLDVVMKNHGKRLKNTVWQMSEAESGTGLKLSLILREICPFFAK